MQRLSTMQIGEVYKEITYDVTPGLSIRIERLRRVIEITPDFIVTKDIYNGKGFEIWALGNMPIIEKVEEIK